MYKRNKKIAETLADIDGRLSDIEQQRHANRTFWDRIRDWGGAAAAILMLVFTALLAYAALF